MGVIVAYTNGISALERDGVKVMGLEKDALMPDADFVILPLSLQVITTRIYSCMQLQTTWEF